MSMKCWPSSRNCRASSMRRFTEIIRILRPPDRGAADRPGETRLSERTAGSLAGTVPRLLARPPGPVAGRTRRNQRPSREPAPPPPPAAAIPGWPFAPTWSLTIPLPAGSPVIVEISPTYKNLFGTIEHEVNLFGRVSTDFTHIKPGSLLRASGGYLVLDLEDALTEPLVWKQLKRALKSGQLLTEVYDPLALLSTMTLKPQPIPIDTKVVALGSPELYYLLYQLDEDFRELFKIRADFGPETGAASKRMRHTPASSPGRSVPRNSCRFDAPAVAEIIRFGVREAAHQDKLSVEFGAVADIVREAGHWARREGAAVVGAGHVRRTLQEQIYRSERLAEKIRELIAEGTLRLSVTGSRVGQINGLADPGPGRLPFLPAEPGHRHRGRWPGGAGQHQRESDLSGGIHDKGVFILEGYLRSQYARRHPLALSASIAFEQSYGWIEGDSASAAELFCLLSADQRCSASPGRGRYRLGEPARRGAGGGRRQREDRRFF